MRVTFNVDTTPSMFSNWLIQHTKDESWAGLLKFPNERGTIHLHEARIESVDPHTKVMRLSIRGHNHIPLPDGSILAAPNWDGSEYITFKLVPLSEQRTVVTAKCGVPLIQPYFRMLLTTISERYPASADAINEALQHPTASLAEVLASLATQELPASWHIVLDCSLPQFEEAAQKHLLPLRTDHPIPDYAVSISRDYESDNGVYLRYNVTAGVEEPAPDAPNVLSLKRREIGHISGAYDNALQTRLTIQSEELDDPTLKPIVAGFLEGWSEELRPAAKNDDTMSQKPTSEERNLVPEDSSDDLSRYFEPITIAWTPDKLETWLRYEFPPSSGSGGVTHRSFADATKSFIYEPTPSHGHIVVDLHYERPSKAYLVITPQVVVSSENLWPEAIVDMDLLRSTLAEFAPSNRLTAVESSVADDWQPWEGIPDYRWDRKAVQLLWQGLEDPEIAKRLGSNVEAKTVTNRISVLRKQFPALVPTRRELRKLQRSL